MSETPRARTSNLRAVIGLAVLASAAIAALTVFLRSENTQPDSPANPNLPSNLNYQPRKPADTSGFQLVITAGPRWSPRASLGEVAAVWDRRGFKILEELDRRWSPEPGTNDALDRLLAHTLVHIYEGRAQRAYELATEARQIAEKDPLMAEEWRYTWIYYQGITALRRGEDENCILCRGESSCILPIAAAAIHTNPQGSRAAIRHFTEYLEQFPDDLAVRWNLNLAHMTLGEHPQGVDPRFLIRLDKFQSAEHGIGKFRDIGHVVGINRLNEAGGAILEDFDGDGLLDFAVTSMEPTVPLAIYRNKGDGTFEDRTESAGVAGQLGGLNCVQSDYNNDGYPDILIIRGAWLDTPIRPSLLRNNGNFTFTDVTEAAGISKAVNSISACWADYDNDGHLDLFICGESSANLLYRNRKDGTFEEVAAQAGVAGKGLHCKGANWIDFDNDGALDIFVNHLNGAGQLFRNNGNGTFRDVTSEMKVEGPISGFACWSWDYDNDGWLDLFATSYIRPLPEIVKSLQGEPTTVPTGRLFRNLKGKGFEDVTQAVGLDMPFATMGSNFGDFDGDGFLDFYLGTGDPNIDLLVPNRMFRNLGGKRFADISISSGTAHLQKGHGVGIGDWDRNGTIDLFVQMGGAIPGDRYHNILFQNPGNTNSWLNVKLVGKKSNRAAIGARITVVTEGQTIHRHVTTGSSFGANPFEQLIGLGTAKRITRLEVTWPTSGTTQVFRDIPVNQAIIIEEFTREPQTRSYTSVQAPTR